MKKILITAGSEGLGNQVFQYFQPNSVSVSRRNGFDIRLPEIRSKIAQMSLDFDVMFNHAYAMDDSQTQLLELLFKTWKENKKSGHIFSTGTYGTHQVLKIDPIYIENKKKLDALHKQCCWEIHSQGLPFKMTLFRPGMLDTERSRNKPHWPGNGVRGHDVAHLMEFIINMPKDLLIEDIVLSPIVFK